MTPFRKNILALALLTGTLATPQAFAEGNDLEFDTRISSISVLDGGLTVLTILVQGFAVPLVVDNETELEHGSEKITLADLREGDGIHVEAYFEDGTLVADEITLVDAKGAFALRGEISALDFAASPTATSSLNVTTVTLLGVEVIVDEQTRITARGRGLGNRVPAEDLNVGDEVKLAGSYEDGLLWADRIHVGERNEGSIQIEGHVGSLNATGFVLELRRGGQLQVILNESTELRGTLDEGDRVSVEGLLNENLAVLASEVKTEARSWGGRGRFQVTRPDREDDDDDARPGQGRGRDNGGNSGRGEGRGND